MEKIKGIGDLNNVSCSRSPLKKSSEIIASFLLKDGHYHSVIG